MVASGMAASSALVLGLLKPGDGIVFLGPLYGGTESLFRGLAERFGVAMTAAGEGDLAGAITDRTRKVWVETPTNPTLDIRDLAGIAAFGPGARRADGGRQPVRDALPHAPDRARD